MLQKIDYKDLDSLNNGQILDLIHKSYGDENSLGVLLITNIPDFDNQKLELMKLSKKFASLPDDTKKMYEDKESLYAFGWSHGKEKFKNGKYDSKKGSYYANPIHDIITDNKELIKKFPFNYRNNIWPDNHLPNYSYEFKKLGNKLFNIGLKVLKLSDTYLKHNIGKDYEDNYLVNLIQDSKTYKARLLHYFENKQNEEVKSQDSACGWHLDHGCLTILTNPTYLDNDYNVVTEPEGTGLIIRNKKEKLIRVRLPKNSVLCQIGETLQILSGGYFRATPHAVSGKNLNNVTRETYPLFIDCNPLKDISIPKFAKDNVLETYGITDNIVPLKDRYNGCKYYYEFAAATYKSYYD